MKMGIQCRLYLVHGSCFIRLPYPLYPLPQEGRGNTFLRGALPLLDSPFCFITSFQFPALVPLVYVMPLAKC
jgi:hypothetical protein